MSQIRFHTEDIEFNLPPNSTKTWIKNIITKEGRDIESINYIFSSDSYLLKINTNYLGKEYLTDIITFDNSESNAFLEGDIFISIERVRDNAKHLDVSFQQELSRVIIHGILHLLGYKDKTKEEKIQMRKKEEDCLSLQNK